VLGLVGSGHETTAFCNKLDAGSSPGQGSCPTETIPLSDVPFLPQLRKCYKVLEVRSVN